MSIALALGGLVACSDTELLSPGEGDTDNPDVGTGDMAEEDMVTTDSVETDAPETGTEDTDTPDPWADFHELFEECSGDGQCEGDEVCFQSVCVKEPLIEAALYREENDSYVPLGAPDLDCYQSPIVSTSAEPELVTMQGSVDLFGPESPTRGLCVSIFNQELYLRWFTWLDENVCGERFNEDPRDQEPYVNCFALDPCRCEDEDFTAYRDGSADSVNDCYAEIGYCDGIEGDDDALDTCRANILERTGIEADTLIYASVASESYEPNPDRTEGVYSVDGIPTNTYLVSKVSGNMRRWRDTYEHGVFLSADSAEEGVVGWSTNVITDGAWRTIPQSAGVPDPIPPEGTAIAGVIRDCGGDTSAATEGARVGLIYEPTQLAYFNGVSGDNLPQPGQAYTNTDGVYAGINAPPGPNRVSVVAMMDDELVSAGLRDVFATPFSVVIATFEGDFSAPEE